MWDYSLLSVNKGLVDQFKKYARISGIIFIILGIIGIVYPLVMSATTLFFVAALMLLLGVISGWMTWITNKEDWAGWLKTFLLVLVSMLMLFYPMEGIATLGLLFAVYFFFDAFASAMLAFSLKPLKGWGWWLVNSIASLVIGVIFLVGWPFTSLFLVGLLVGISLLLDGLALLIGSIMISKAEKTAEAE